MNQAVVLQRSDDSGDDTVHFVKVMTPVMILSTVSNVSVTRSRMIVMTLVQ